MIRDQYVRVVEIVQITGLHPTKVSKLDSTFEQERLQVIITDNWHGDTHTNLTVAEEINM